MKRLRAKSIELTAYLESMIRSRLPRVLEIATPSEPARRGCQLSLRVQGPRESGRSLFEHLGRDGVVCDWREPDVIRVAPAPLYNRRVDCLAFVRSVERWAAAR
jgi:kynureninase